MKKIDKMSSMKSSKYAEELSSMLAKSSILFDVCLEESEKKRKSRKLNKN